MDERTLKVLAGEAADRLVAEVELGIGIAAPEWLHPLLAIAWIDGRQAGGDEAQAILREYIASLS